MHRTTIMMVVPLYKQEGLIGDLFTSLASIDQELNELGVSILFINDSPLYDPLAIEIESHLSLIKDKLKFEIHVNNRNIGFVRSCNFGFAIAKERKCDVLLLNSDAILYRGVITELKSVSQLDPMIAVVSPRSNNATICNSPYPDEFRSLSAQEAYASHESIQHLLPRITYVPTAVGFCLYIRLAVLQEFGDFDTAYGDGYNEENDLIMRANQRGFRAVLANHAFVYHIGSLSFNSTATPQKDRERDNSKILDARYPEYRVAIERYFSSIDYKAQYLLGGLSLTSKHKKKFLFDCTNFGSYFNGTFEHSKRLIQNFLSRYSEEYDFFISCRPEAALFHGLDEFVALKQCWGNERENGPFAVAVYMGQPFNYEALHRVVGLAPVSGFLFLDTIAMDCLHLDAIDLESLWSNMASACSFLCFNSDFSRRQFELRIRSPQNLHRFVSLCSTDERDYYKPTLPAVVEKEIPFDKYVLVIGNKFKHKNVLNTVEEIKKYPSMPCVIVLGIEIDDEEKIRGFASGEESQSFIERLYDCATVVIFPSSYEGFGLPILHALARKKPVVARNLPVNLEIRARNRYAHNIHLCETTVEIVKTALSMPAWSSEPTDVTTHSWEDAADQLAAGIKTAISNLTYSDLENRLRSRSAAKFKQHYNDRGLSNNKRLCEVVSANGEENRSGSFIAASFDPLNLYKVRVPASPVLDYINLAGIKALFAPTFSVLLGRQRAKTPGYIRLSGPVLNEKDWNQLSEASLSSSSSSEIKILIQGDWRSKDFQARFQDLVSNLLLIGCLPKKINYSAKTIYVICEKRFDWINSTHELNSYEFISACYKNLLGRMPDQDGILYFTSKIVAGGARSRILKDISFSDERVNNFGTSYFVAADSEGLHIRLRP